MTHNAKFAVKIAILTVGLVGTFLAGSTKKIALADGGPLILCPPKTSCAPIGVVADGGPILVCPPDPKHPCSNNLPPVSVADGGPILVCPPSQKNCNNNLPPPPASVADGGSILVCPPNPQKPCSNNLPPMIG